VARLVAAVADGLGLADPRMTARIARRFVDDALGHLRDNLPALKHLARGARLGIVSNFYGNLARVCEDAGIRPLFSVLVDSAQVGCAKPEPRIFFHALDALGLGPADATFVGDSLQRDMAGARAVGMRHIWLVAEAAPAQDPCCRGDRVIHSLKDLAGLDL
jgi:FMN phosphatase YigB (HAD superfamily)